MKSLLFVALVALVTISSVKPGLANPFEYKFEELAPGVWAAIRPDPFELPQEGNAVFVMTSEGVVLFDAGGSPLMGEAIVKKVRSLTDQPIVDVVISHWHGDHMRGLQSIREAFPHVQIFAHPFARDFIAANQDKWNTRRVKMVPGVRKNIETVLAKNVDLSGRPLIDEEKKWIVDGQGILDQLDSENNKTTFVVPTATFTDHLYLYLGGREIRFEHLGNAHTAGDVVMWLPQEKIIATGDIVTGPVPLDPSPYMSEYNDVLAKIKALGFKTLVPGHGAVLHDAQYLDVMSELIGSVSKQIKLFVAKGVDEKEAIGKIDYSDVEPKFTHGDKFLHNRFLDYVAAGSFAHAAYLAETGKPMQEVF